MKSKLSLDRRFEEVEALRLWHYQLIPYLDRQRLLGQHRECCALRGKGWNRKHATVNYVFEHPYATLYNYHCLVMDEMHQREFKVTSEWWFPTWRGKNIGHDYSDFTRWGGDDDSIYQEHDDAYLDECLELLKAKGSDTYEAFLTHGGI